LLRSTVFLVHQCPVCGLFAESEGLPCKVHTRALRHCGQSVRLSKLGPLVRSLPVTKMLFRCWKLRKSPSLTLLQKAKLIFL
jgi:hypothetical protein